MTERELKLLIDAQAIKRVQIHYAVMAQGYMVIADGKALETTKRETREFKTSMRRRNCCSSWASRNLR